MTILHISHPVPVSFSGVKRLWKWCRSSKPHTIQKIIALTIHSSGYFDKLFLLGRFWESSKLFTRKPNSKIILFTLEPRTPSKLKAVLNIVNDVSIDPLIEKVAHLIISLSSVTPYCWFQSEDLPVLVICFWGLAADQPQNADASLSSQSDQVEATTMLNNASLGENALS